MTTLSFKFLELLPFVIFQAKFFCPEHNLNSISHINLRENMLVFYLYSNLLFRCCVTKSPIGGGSGAWQALLVSFNSFPSKPWFSRVCRKGFLKTLWEKEKLLEMSNFSISRSVFYPQFLLFPQCFLPIWKTFFYFHQTQNCRLQTLSVWKGLKFVVWEKVNLYQMATVENFCKLNMECISNDETRNKSFTTPVSVF